MGRIVWLASYPKSGNTWVRALLGNYLGGGERPTPINELQHHAADESKPNWYAPHTGGRLPGSLSPEETTALRERVHADIAAAAGSGDVFVKTHNRFGRFDGHPLHNLAVTAGVVYVVRNPLDVAPSLADHFGLGLDEAIEFMGNDLTGSPGDEANVGGILGSWSGHVASWLDSRLLLRVVRYEDLHADTAGAFAGLVRFLGLPFDQARLARAVGNSSFEELRRQEERDGFVERSPSSQRFFRAGTVGHGQAVLTQAQVERITHRHRALMERFAYLGAAPR